jgi:hypothetical protein
MVLAALLLVCSIPQMDDAAKLGSEFPAAASETKTADSKTNDASASAALPAMPTPKVKSDAEAVTPNPAGQPFQPVKPAFTRPQETPRQRKIWYGLLIAGHSGAAFDAWSTHRAVSGGYGTESNPFLRPFAGSNAIYAVTQISPTVMDFVGKKMMVSQNRYIRKAWWIPQLAGASFSFAAGAHNVGVVH